MLTLELPILHGVDFSLFFYYSIQFLNYPYYMELIKKTEVSSLTPAELPILHGVDSFSVEIDPLFSRRITHITWS